MSNYHDDLVRSVKDSPEPYLGDDSIKLKIGVVLPGSKASDKIESQKVYPDLIGTDSEGNIVIVEVKTGLLRWKPDVGDSYDLQNSNAAVRESVGQMLDYARAKIRDMYPNSKPTTEELSRLTKKLRLFIVSDDYSPAVRYVSCCVATALTYISFGFTISNLDYL